MATKLAQHVECVCDKCGYEWQPRDAEIMPYICPKCKSPRWNETEDVRKGN